MVNFRYQDKGTIVHRLNPFCKLIWIVSVLIFALIFDNPLYILLIFLSTLPVIFASNVAKSWLSLMKPILYLCFVIIFINALVSNDGSHILVEFPFSVPVIGTPIITLEGIFFGFIMCLRLTVIITAFAVLTFTIHPDDLMLSMIKLRLPYRSVLVTSLSTRFIPTLINDVERITDVQKSRGLELDKGSLIRRIKSRMAIIIPLLSNSLDRTVQVAEAMESRAFGAAKRTFYKEIRINLIDAIVIAFILLTICLGVFFRIDGYGDYQYYPSISGINMNIRDWLFVTSLSLSLLAIIPFALLKRKIDLD